MRICALDVGTNTVQCLVADVAGGHLAVVADEERFARLGQGVDASRRLAPEAMDRVVARLAEAQATAARTGAARTVVAATSASRDAANVDVLVDRVRRELGMDYRVIAGETEAAFSFAGALAMLPPDALGPADEAVVIDVGGGSTEVAAGHRARGLAARASLDVGSVRLTERHLRPLPAGPDASARAEADVRAALDASGLDLDALAGRPVVVTGSIARLVARLASAPGDPPVVPATTVRAWRERLLALSPAEALAIDPEALAGREDVVAAAVLVVDTLLDALGAPAYLATRGGLRHGLALAVAVGQWDR